MTLISHIIDSLTKPIVTDSVCVSLILCMLVTFIMEILAPFLSWFAILCSELIGVTKDFLAYFNRFLVSGRLSAGVAVATISTLFPLTTGLRFGHILGDPIG